jgi:hypothetical protein
MKVKKMDYSFDGERVTGINWFAGIKRDKDNLIVNTTESQFGCFSPYYISPELIAALMANFDFDVVAKRTRLYLVNPRRKETEVVTTIVP